VAKAVSAKVFYHCNSLSLLFSAKTGFAVCDLGPVIAVCCEDDEDEIWRRLDLILAHYGASVLKYALRVCGLKCVGLK
jgi:hypothetical protein